MGPSTTIAYKRLASLLASRRGHPYSTTIRWLRCQLSFSLLRSAIRGTRASASPQHSQSPWLWRRAELREQITQTLQFCFITMHGILLACMLICFTVLYVLLYFTFNCPRQCACVPYVLLYILAVYHSVELCTATCFYAFVLAILKFRLILLLHFV